MSFFRILFELIPNCPEYLFYSSFVILHKFFRKVSKYKYDKCLLITACLLLASKLKGNPIKLNELVVVCYNAELRINKKPLKRISTQRAFEIKNSLRTIESDILSKIGFDLEIELPYKYIQEYKNYPAPNISKVLQIASYFCNDSFLMPLCLYYNPAQIACSCIYFSTLYLKTPLPGFNEHPWYKYLHSEVEFHHIQEITNFLKLIYKKNRSYNNGI